MGTKKYISLCPFQMTRSLWGASVALESRGTCIIHGARDWKSHAVYAY